MIRVALLSFWHVHARDYAREALAHPDVELVAIWDENASRGAKEAAERGVAFLPNLEAVLADRTIDAVIVTTRTVAHAEVISAALTAGKAVFTEKVLGATLREAIDLRDQAYASELPLGVALARTRIPEMDGMRGIIASGRLGRLTHARVRIAHGGVVPSTTNPNGWLPERFLDPSEAAGGAMIDLGAHPLYLTRLLLGMPYEISASYARVTGKMGDDNAVAVFSYSNGAIGIAETGFVSKASPIAVEVHGFEASAIANSARSEIEIASLDSDGKRVWTFEPLDLSPRPTPFDDWIDHIQKGTLPDLSLAVQVSALVEATARSARTSARVRLDHLEGWADRA